jgi:hypothetical protein
MIHFFSYGNDSYRNSKQRIQQEAYNMGFDKVYIYGPENLPQEFLDKTKPHIFHPRGAGYWLWKSYFLKQIMDSAEDNDIIIYADAGCHLNVYGKPRLEEYLKIINEHESGFLGLQMNPENLSEQFYTNEMVFEYFNIGPDDPIRKMGQYVGGILFIRKCDISKRIIDDYYSLAITRPDLFSDVHNDYKRTSIFRDHRHDQSILGLLRKKYNAVTIPDETWDEDFRNKLHVPILATRIRG